MQIPVDATKEELEDAKIKKDTKGAPFNPKLLNPARVRFCFECNAYKPPRAHHCRDCGVYVKRSFNDGGALTNFDRAESSVFLSCTDISACSTGEI